METVRDFIFLGSKITVEGDRSHEIKRHLLLGRKAMTNLDSILKSKDFANKGTSRQSYGFWSSHVWMWELGHKEGWVPENLCFQTVVIEKTLESPLDSKVIKAVNPKGNQLWIFFGRTDAEAEAPILWPPNEKNRFFGKDPWTVVCQAPLSTEFSRQEYWSGLPFPTPGDLPDPGIEPECPTLAGGFFTTEPSGWSPTVRGAEDN